jgi:hypothetical protein
MRLFTRHLIKTPHPLRYAPQVLRMKPAPARFALRFAPFKASYITPNFERLQFAGQYSKAVANSHMQKRGIFPLKDIKVSALPAFAYVRIGYNLLGVCPQTPQGRALSPNPVAPFTRLVCPCGQCFLFCLIRQKCVTYNPTYADDYHPTK